MKIVVTILNKILPNWIFFLKNQKLIYHNCRMYPQIVTCSKHVHQQTKLHQHNEGGKCYCHINRCSKSIWWGNSFLMVGKITIPPQSTYQKLYLKIDCNQSISYAMDKCWKYFLTNLKQDWGCHVTNLTQYSIGSFSKSHWDRNISKGITIVKVELKWSNYPCLQMTWGCTWKALPFHPSNS